VQDDLGRTPLHHAVHHPDMLRLLLLPKHHADARHHHSQHQQHPLEEQQAVGGGAEVDAEDAEGRTALWLAVAAGQEAGVRVLIVNGADPEHRDSKGSSASHQAPDYLRKVMSDARAEMYRRSDVRTLRRYEKVVARFNNKPTAAVQELLSSRAFTESCPADVARFLHNCADLNKTRIGELLGEPGSPHDAVLAAFVDYMDFGGLDFVHALRQFLSKFRLPGESQKIDRIMECFAHRYCVHNPNTFPHEDLAYLLAFSVIMLNTDLHSAQIKHKISKAAFIKNNSGINDFPDLPPAYLGEVYDKILRHEIKLKDNDDIAVAAGIAKQGTLLFRLRKKSWKKRFTVLKHSHLFLFRNDNHANSSLAALARQEQHAQKQLQAEKSKDGGDGKTKGKGKDTDKDKDKKKRTYERFSLEDMQVMVMWWWVAEW
jgi:Sec7 domain/Ankyrin repeat